jgi:hypothetical protein
LIPLLHSFRHNREIQALGKGDDGRTDLGIFLVGSDIHHKAAVDRFGNNGALQGKVKARQVMNFGFIEKNKRNNYQNQKNFLNVNISL